MHLPLHENTVEEGQYSLHLRIGELFVMAEEYYKRVNATLRHVLGFELRKVELSFGDSLPTSRFMILIARTARKIAVTVGIHSLLIPFLPSPIFGSHDHVDI